METIHPDPLDALWTPVQRAAGRERCREEAEASARDVIASRPIGFQDDAARESFIGSVVEAWLLDHDERVERVAAIMRAPEAAGREDLARHLALETNHSAAVATGILSSSGKVAAMPAGRERTERVAVLRGADAREAR